MQTRVWSPHIPDLHCNFVSSYLRQVTMHSIYAAIHLIIKPHDNLCHPLHTVSSLACLYIGP